MTSADALGYQDALAVLMPGFTGTTLPDWLGALLRDGLAGVCLFGHNVDTFDQVAALTEAIYTANPHAIISIDEEGGDVSRLHQREGSPFPGNALLGRLDDLEVTQAVANTVGEQLASVGIRLVLAPVADVNSNLDNPVIGVRSFGPHPEVVASHTAAWVEGVQAAGVAACAKHFPGHGDTSSDSHVSEPVVAADERLLSARDLLPFQTAIAAGTKAIMTSHIRVPALDPEVAATFSPAILGGVLRERLGFDGVVVTDALDMIGASGERGLPTAAVTAIAAGSDLLCLGSDTSEDEVSTIIDALTAAVGSAQLPPDRLADARSRCLTLSRWLADQRLRGATSYAQPTVSPATVASLFSLSDRAKAVLDSGGSRVRWVRIEPEPNAAIGATPFGPFFDGGAPPALVVPLDERGAAASYVAEPGVVTIVVGREFHRDEGALRAAQTIAAKGTTVVVDMGIANCDAVDIATFGASRIVGQALIELVYGSA